LAQLKLVVVTPERKSVETACDEVELPGEMGNFGVLPGHTPLIALLTIGKATYRSGKTRYSLALGAGFAEVGNDVVTVLTDFAETADQIDAAAAARAKTQAEEALKTANPDTFPGIRAALDTAQARLEVTKTN
jgi:F-type H+-transporting ATPase subunit epsilon